MRESIIGLGIGGHAIWLTSSEAKCTGLSCRAAGRRPAARGRMPLALLEVTPHVRHGVGTSARVAVVLVIRAALYGREAAPWSVGS